MMNYLATFFLFSYKQNNESLKDYCSTCYLNLLLKPILKNEKQNIEHFF